MSFTVSDYVPFTKILSANINSDRNDIKNRLNWDGTAATGLSDDNVQSASVSGGGLNPLTKLKVAGGTAGQFLGTNGSAIIWANNPLTSQFNVVLGSAAQVTSGTATNSTFASIVQADGMRILVLPAYATSESWTLTNKLYIQGLGASCTVDGAITFSTGSSQTKLAGIRTTNDITINSGITGIYANDIWFSTTHTFVEGNSSPSNILFGIQET